MFGCDNCNGNTRQLSGPQRGLGGAPSWYDNIINSASVTAENIWNDVESAAVWADNTLLGPFSAQSAVNAGQSDAQGNGLFSDLMNPGAIPGNPISQGYAAGSATRQGIISGFKGLSQDIAMPLIIGAGILLAVVLLEKK